MKAILLLVPLLNSAIVAAQTFSLESVDGLKFHGTQGKAETYKGRKALRVIEAETQHGEDLLTVIGGTDFIDGVIEIDLAGSPRQSAVQGARGFVGVAFRVNEEPPKYDAFYLRPTNGRAEDQVRRNHSAQYISFPGFPWEKLRKEEPEKYESYVDLVPGEWTKVKIDVRGARARLFVHGNAQPTLLVNDLKGGGKGAIALWIGPGTEARFSNLRITK